MPEPKVALVTGAGRGIGRDIAQRMAREGYAVGPIARGRARRDCELIRQKGGKALVTPTDVSKREQVLASVEAVERELGPIAVLINNAGAYLRKPFMEITEEDFDFQLKVNTYGPFFAPQAVVGKMAERGAGTIIFVLGSESRSGPLQYSAYNASKLAQRAMAGPAPTNSCIAAFMRSPWTLTAPWMARVTEGAPEEPTPIIRRHRIDWMKSSMDKSAAQRVDFRGGPALLLAVAPTGRGQKNS